MTQTTMKNPPPSPLPGYRENQRRPAEPASGPATQYDEKLCRKSYAMMREFFGETLA